MVWFKFGAVLFREAASESVQILAAVHPFGRRNTKRSVIFQKKNRITMEVMGRHVVPICSRCFLDSGIGRTDPKHPTSTDLDQLLLFPRTRFGVTGVLLQRHGTRGGWAEEHGVLPGGGETAGS